MLRNINEFKGEALIIGGGWCADHMRNKPDVRTRENVYTVDISESAAPDAVVDITDAVQCQILGDKKFAFIYFECLTWLGAEKMLRAFINAKQYLKDDGILVYRGGSKIDEASVPDLLKAAGFQMTLKKEFTPKVGKNLRDNGSLSMASNLSFEQIKERSSGYSIVIQHYLNHYQFLTDEPFPQFPGLHAMKSGYAATTFKIFKTPDFIFPSSYSTYGYK